MACGLHKRPDEIGGSGEMRQELFGVETAGSAQALLAERAKRQSEIRELFASVAKTCELPPLPAVAMRALSLAKDPETEAGELSRVVASDAALSARVLRISRSVLYARRHPPRSLKEAVLTVGFQALRKILIAACTRAVFEKSDAVTESLWNHALATALACDELSQEFQVADRGWGFVLGLLHDIGKQILHMGSEAAFHEVWRRVANGEGSFAELESGLFGLEHALVGASLASQWGLDDELAEGILFHHKPQELPGALLPRLVCLADHVAYRAGLGGAPGAITPLACEVAEGIDEGRLEELAAWTKEAFEKEKALFL